MESAVSQARVIVVGNEKGGAGKSTIAIHLATALMHGDAKVAVIDLDLRQQSMGHFFNSRRAWTASAGVVLPMPVDIGMGAEAVKMVDADPENGLLRLDEIMARAGESADFVLIDTPGGDTALSRAAHGRADVIVTPMNDSFVDFDLLGQVDPVTLDLIRPSIYAETVWESRKIKAATRGKSIDWRNRKRLEERIVALAKRVGFRIGPGLRDRVIYRELYPFGLTIADLSAKVRPVPVSLGHVAARQELRSLSQALGLSVVPPEEVLAAAS
jgi:chromosome partitioning protein